MTGVCIPKYQKYSYYFDKPVYFQNEGRYFLLMILEVVSLIVYNIAFYQFVGQTILEERSIFFRVPWMIYALVRSGNFLTVFGYFVGSYTLLIKLFHLLVMIFAINSGNTLDEIYNP
jgi:hypothetical protein